MNFLVILTMLRFYATVPEPEDHYSPAELETSANIGHSELVRSSNAATSGLLL